MSTTKSYLRRTLLVILIFSSQLMATTVENNTVWLSQNEQSTDNVHLYFFWSKQCPHCLEALPFVNQLVEQFPWLVLHSFDISNNPQYVQKYKSMASALDKRAKSVPGFLLCGQMYTGYDNEANMGQFLIGRLQQCHQQGEIIDVVKSSGLEGSKPLLIPLLGELDPASYSLPVYTLILAGLDAFNPCAFFVLLFLLSLLVNAKDRKRMIIVGGIFVFCSGLLYFLFMAAWLNVFLLIGQLNVITLVAGCIAIFIAAINIKDYFRFKQGISLSIPEHSKNSLFKRMRRTIQSGSLSTMIAATIGLSIFANMYEFICTAGFPMVYTRILTLHELSSVSYYLYLLLYNIIYVIPLLLIVLVFTLTLGRKKLSETEGRTLKLISGIMMLLMGLLLIAKPDWLNNAGIALLLLIITLLISGLIIRTDKRKKS